MQISMFDGVKPFKITKPIRLITLFSGYDSQALSLKYLGIPFEHYKTSEWAIKSIQALKDLHFSDDNTDYSENMTVAEVNSWLSGRISSDYSTPLNDKQIEKLSEKEARKIYNNMRATHNLGSIMTINGNDLQIVDTDKYDYILTYSFPCVPAGTMVKTIDGYKPIEDIEVGDLVLTHNNQYKKVLKTMSRVSDHINHIRANGIADLQITDEHPLYVLRNNNQQWVKAKDLLLSDKVSFNITNNTNTSKVRDDVLWLLGRYVADGHINKYTYNSVNFSISFEKEDEFLKNIPKEFIDKFKKFKKQCWDYRIADKEIKEACEEFGIGAKNKEIPQWVFELPIEKKKAFLDGYLSGDGHIRQIRRQTLFCTVSHKLFLGLQQLIIDVYGTVCCLNIRKDKRKETFNDTYNGQFTINSCNNEQRVIQDKIFTPIRSIKRENGLIKVFNIEVKDDNSYTCENTIVHNCQDLSSAGKGAGMEKGSGTRSGLLWEVERLLKETKELPQVLLMENVPEVIGSKNIKHFAKWVEFLDNLGYHSKWGLLNAKDFGIAQNRSRCFMVSVLGDYYYDMPTGFKLPYVLKDFLDKKVDESYYLKNETIRSLNLHKERHEAQGHGFGWKPSNGGGIAHTIKTEGGYRPQSNFIIEQSRKADRESRNGSCEHDNGERLQRVWQSIDEHGNGSTPPYEIERTE